MTKARDISDLLDATGDIKSTALDNVPPSNDASALTTGTIDNARISLDANEIPNLDTAKITTGTFADARMPSTVLNSNVDLTNLSASNLTSGTLPDARFPSTLPAVSGANLTNLPGGGKILQVKSVVKKDRTSISNTSFTDISGLSVSITPSASNSKIFINAFIGAIGGNGYQAYLGLARGGTNIIKGDAAGSTFRTTVAFDDNISTTNIAGGFNITFLDSPSSTSQQTYSLQAAVRSGGFVLIGGTSNTTLSYFASGACSLVVMEVSA